MSHTPFNMIQDQLDPTHITDNILNITLQWMNDQQSYPTESQKKALVSHLGAMVLRAKNLGDPLPDIEVDLFDEISESSINLAKKVVNLLVGLPIEEAYLLSIHFEVAKAKTV